MGARHGALGGAKGPGAGEIPGAVDEFHQIPHGGAEFMPGLHGRTGVDGAASGEKSPRAADFDGGMVWTEWRMAVIELMGRLLSGEKG